MAIRDVKEYYYAMLAQYLEEKQNLEDFSDALKEGLITEEQMQDAIDNVASLEENYHRLAYIMYLFNMPSRATKKPRYIRQHKPILDEYDFSIERKYPIKRINIWFGGLTSKKLEQFDLFSDNTL